MKRTRSLEKIFPKRITAYHRRRCSIWTSAPYPRPLPYPPGWQWADYAKFRRLLKVQKRAKQEYTDILQEVSEAIELAPELFRTRDVRTLSGAVELIGSLEGQEVIDDARIRRDCSDSKVYCFQCGLTLAYRFQHYFTIPRRPSLYLDVCECGVQEFGRDDKEAFAPSIAWAFHLMDEMQAGRFGDDIQADDSSDGGYAWVSRY